MTITNPDLLARLRLSGVDPACPFVREATTAAELPAHATWIATTPALMPALVFTWQGLDGTVVEQVNPMVPVVSKAGEESKYLWPAGQSPILNVLDHRPTADTVVIVEGTKQTLAAMRYAKPSWQIVGIGGCSSWTRDGIADPMLARLVKGKPVVVIFDADWQSNRNVWEAAKKLGEAAMTFGATEVRWGVIPGRGTTGLDDVLGALDEPLRADVLERVVSSAATKVGRAPRANKAAGASPFYDGKSAQVEKIAQDIMLHRSLALDSAGEVCVYRDGVYRRDHRELRGEVVDRLQDHYTRGATGAVADILYKLLSDAGLVIPESASEPLLNVANGMLDLRTGKLHPHDPKYLSAQQIPVEWHPDARCPVYEKWILGQTSDVADLEESVSLMLDPTRVPTKAVFLYGPSRSGKSTMLRVAQKMIGPENCSAVSLAQLVEDKFAVARLYGKVLNTSADLSAAALNDMSVFKMVTGEDAITAQHKYGQLFSFTNRALFMFSANVPPAVSETSTAYLERIKPFIFPNSFAGHEDPSIEEAMLAELPGILVRFVRAYQAWKARGWYRPTDPEVADDFAVHADRVRAWMKAETVVPAAPAGMSGRDLFQAYHQWAVDNAYGKLGLQAFLAKLVSAGVVEYPPSKVSRARRFRLQLRAGGFGTEPPAAYDLSSKAQLPQPKGSEVAESSPEVAEVALSPLIVSSSVLTSNEGETEREVDGERSRAKAQLLQHPLAVDFETPAADLVYADPSTYLGPFPRVLGWDDGHGFAGTTSDPSVMREILTSAPRLIVHDGWRYDLPLAAFHLGLDVVELIGKADDLIILSRLNRPPRDRDGRLDQYDLDHLAAVHLGTEKSDALKRLKREFKGYDRIPTDHPDYLGYLAQDADITRRLYDVAEELTADPYYQREREVAVLAARLTLTGLRVDTDLLADRLDAQNAREKAIRDRLVELGFPNSASPGTTKAGKALLTALANGTPIPTTATGSISTARDVLSGLALPTGHPLAEPVELLVALSEERPFAATVAENLNDGRIHPEHLISGVNGRWSTKRPNIMGVGKRSDDLLRDRELILPEPGEVFIQADLKGIDNRSVAGLSGDRAYAALLAPGVEINAELARMFYGEGVDFHAVKAKIKAIGHGINFGRGARAIARDNGLPLSEVRRVWNEYFDAFPDLAAWQKHIREEAQAGRELPNGHGRYVRCTPGKEFTEAPARQTASCTRDLAMNGLLRLGDDRQYLRMFIHDEAVLSVPEEIADDVLTRVVTAMSFDWTSPSGLVIPIIAEPSTARGKTWAGVYDE